MSLRPPRRSFSPGPAAHPSTWRQKLRQRATAALTAAALAPQKPASAQPAPTDRAPETTTSAAPLGLRADRLASRNALADHGRRALAGRLGTLEDPSIRVEVGAGEQLPRIAIRGLDDAAALLARPRDAHAEAGASVTARFGVGPGASSRRATLEIGAGVHGAASAALAAGDAATFIDETQRAVQTMTAIGGQVDALKSDDAAPLKDFVDLVQRLRRGEADPAVVAAEGVALAGAVAESLERASRRIDALDALLSGLGTSVGVLQDKALRAGASATFAGYGELTMGGRTPTVSLGGHHFDVAARLHAVVPFDVAAKAEAFSSTAQALLQVQSSLVAVRSTLDVRIAGLRELRSGIDGLRASLDTLRPVAATLQETAETAAADPVAALADLDDAANTLESAIDTLTVQRDHLEASAAAASAALGLDIAAKLQVEQATAPVGVGLDEVALRWTHAPSFDVALSARATLHHGVGVLGGRVHEIAVEDLERGLTQVGPTAANVYSTFFPRALGLDAQVSLSPRTGTRTDVRAGVMTDGIQVGASLGVAQLLAGRVLLHLGVVAPDVSALGAGLLLPAAGATVQVGPSRAPERVQLGVDAAMPIDTAAPDGPFRGVHGRFQGTVRF